MIEQAPTSFQRVEVVNKDNRVKVFSTTRGTFNNHERKMVGDYDSYENASASKLKRRRLMTAVHKASGLASGADVFAIYALVFPNLDKILEKPDVLTLVGGFGLHAVISFAGRILSEEERMKADQQLTTVNKASQSGEKSFAWSFSMDPK